MAKQTQKLFILFFLSLTFSLISACQADEENNPSTNTVATPPSVSSSDKTTAQSSDEASKTQSVEANNKTISDNKAASPQINATAKTETFVEGQDYISIFPQMPTNNTDGKIEVVELFWYGCPHCFHLEPDVKKWLTRKPDNIRFVQTPATLNPSWAFHARAFYTAQLLDPTGEKNLHSKIFEAIHNQGRRLNNENALKRFFTHLGINEEAFNNAFNSMEMNITLEKATEISTASQSNSVPSIIVAGKYRTGVSMAGSPERMFKIVEYLSQQE